jgi:uncharacterized surface protein with fasciclin (FAS1) repeats
MMTRTGLLALAAAAFAVSACGTETGGNDTAPAAAAAEERRSIGEGLAASDDHRRLVEALNAAGMAEVLSGAGRYTLFAPTDAAFERIPESDRAALLAPEQRARLTALLSSHIVPGTVMAEDLEAAVAGAQGGRAELATVGGANLLVTRDGDGIRVSSGTGAGARILRADALHANGVVHTVDSVVMPAAD